MPSNTTRSTSAGTISTHGLSAAKADGEPAEDLGLSVEVGGETVWLHGVVPSSSTAGSAASGTYAQRGRCLAA